MSFSGPESGAAAGLDGPRRSLRKREEKSCAESPDLILEEDLSSSPKAIKAGRNSLHGNSVHHPGENNSSNNHGGNSSVVAAASASLSLASNHAVDGNGGAFNSRVNGDVEMADADGADGVNQPEEEEEEEEIQHDETTAPVDAMVMPKSSL